MTAERRTAKYARKAARRLRRDMRHDDGHVAAISLGRNERHDYETTYHATGEPVGIRRVWGGHAFTQQEMDNLALGLTITVTTDKGREVPVKLVRRGQRLQIGIDRSKPRGLLERHHRHRL